MGDAAAGQPVFPLEPQKLTWAALLGQWIDFARSATALPTGDADAERVRRTVADIIGLQAVWFALQHLDELDAAQRSLGMDRAEVLIERHERALREAWGDGALPGALEELIGDAREQVVAARSA